MTKNVVKPAKLEEFFTRLNEAFGKFLVLRGYEFLPSGYSNDIDVYVPKEDLGRFFSCLTDLDGLDTSITILMSRLGLIKCELVLEGEVIPLDILYGFYYFGLEYQDCDQLSRKSSLHNSKLFYTPTLSDEVRISLLKELLHNSRVRRDKAIYLYDMMAVCSPELPTEYFDSDTIEVVRCAIRSENLYLPNISKALKKRLLKYNFAKQYFGTARNIILFAAVKYLFKNSYHTKMLK